MSKASHTPGPWEIRELNDPDNNGGGTYYRITGERTLFLDVVECSDGYVPGENEANARLIAASPDLLDACEAVLFHLDYLQNLWSKEGVTDRLAGTLRAAVAKAKGDNGEETR